MKLRTHLLTAAAAALTLIAGCGGGGGDAGPSIVSSANANQTAAEPIVGRLHFILRPDANGNWYVQSDDSHRPSGVETQMVQESTHLRVNFTHSWKYAGTVQVTSDDDFGAVITGHANLGLGATHIIIKANGQTIDPATVWKYLPGATGGNLWVNVTMVD